MAVARRQRRANYWAIGIVAGVLAFVVLIALFMIAMNTSECNAIIEARQVGSQAGEQPEEWQLHCGPITR